MSQQEFWNSKFSRDGYLYGISPNEFIESNTKLFKENAKVLCLGEGEGRNAIFLAKNNYTVTAMDASDIGISKLHFRAIEENVKIETICIDLNHWNVSEKYDVIVASYLHMYKSERETLFKKIEDSLVSGGYFIGEFFSSKQLSYTSGGPKDEDLLYTLDDFQKSFNSCIKKVTQEIVELNEGKGHQGRADVIRVIIEKK